jgi:hypothetical protein
VSLPRWRVRIRKDDVATCISYILTELLISALCTQYSRLSSAFPFTFVRTHASGAAASAELLWFLDGKLVRTNGVNESPKALATVRSGFNTFELADGVHTLQVSGVVVEY